MKCLQFGSLLTGIFYFKTTKTESFLLKTTLIPVFFLIGCSDLGINPDFNKLELELITIDRDGNERNVFDSESDFTLVLNSINHSDDTVNLGPYQNFYLYADENSEFFLVYKESLRGNLVPIGRPFKSPLICLMINISIKIYPHSEQYLFSGRWLDNPQNFPLESGNYYAGFTIDLGGNLYKPEVRFSIQ